jgi:hypothetical protein
MTQRLTDTDLTPTNVTPIRKPLVRPRVKKVVLWLLVADLAVYVAGFLTIRAMAS